MTAAERRELAQFQADVRAWLKGRKRKPSFAANVRRFERAYARLLAREDARVKP
jgi:hypothetical protein